jgi:hypothetical protein
MSHTATSAPASAKAKAMALPIPCTPPAPVTTAILSFRGKLGTLISSLLFLFSLLTWLFVYNVLLILTKSATAFFCY